MTVAIEPGSAAWQRIITPSKVAAILGVSRWESPYRLWHRMHGDVGAQPQKDIFDVGHDFEPAMAAMWKRKNPGWRLSPGEVQTVPNFYPGYPAMVTLDRRASRGRARRVVEFKTGRRLEDWGDFGTDQAPADYVAQVMAQMAFSGYTQHPAHLMVLGPFFEAHTYVIDFDAEVWEAMDRRCAEFWESLSADEPPNLDDSVPTYECVRELHPDITTGETVQVEADAASELLALSLDIKAAETRLRGLKTRLLDRMGNAQYACVGELRIADRRPHAKGSVALNLSTKSLAQLEEMEIAS